MFISIFNYSKNNLFEVYLLLSVHFKLFELGIFEEPKSIPHEKNYSITCYDTFGIELCYNFYWHKGSHLF